MIKKNNGTTTDDVEFVALRFRLVKQPWDASFRKCNFLTYSLSSGLSSQINSGFEWCIWKRLSSEWVLTEAFGICFF